ncbi:MAG: MBL fold metallo-hydrolase [Miltoncostaeaceae bacterium]
MDVHPGDILQIDTLLAGIPGMTSVQLVGGDSPALIDCGAQTTVDVVRSALADAGLGAGDLAWLVLTHIHLDHCGAVGDLSAAFPNATVVVHPRGARHLVEPGRLVQATADVFGRLAPVVGGLTGVAADRIVVADDGHLIPIGPDRSLRVVWAPGHARHHMALLDEREGILFAGDAIGLQLGGGDLYPSIPPPEYDLDAALNSLDVLEALAPERVYVSHSGPVADAGAAFDHARQSQTAIGEAARASWAVAPGDAEALGRAIEVAWPTAGALRTPESIVRWTALNWLDNNVPGLVAMVEREAGAP